MKININFKLSLLVAPPLFLLILLGAVQVFNSASHSSVLSEVTLLIELTEESSLLVNELQIERGLSAGYLGSMGTKFGDALKKQQQQTDLSINRFNQFVEKYNPLINLTEVKDLLSGTTLLFSELDNTRKGIESRSHTVPDTLEYYSKLNNTMLATASLIGKINPDADLTQNLSALFSLLKGQEQAGVELAILMNTFTSNDISEAYYTEFLSLIASQDTYLSTFIAFSDEFHTNLFEQVVADESFEKVERFRYLATNYLLDQPPEEWLSASTDRINKLKELENSVFSSLLVSANASRDSAQFSFLMLITTLVVILVFSLGLTWYLVRNIKLQVMAVKETINMAVHQSDLTARCQVYSKDEIGEIAEQINHMLSQFSEAVSQIGQASDQLATASEQASGVVANNATHLDKQNENTLHIVSALEEMSASVKEVAQNTVDASNLADSAREQVVIGEAAVKESVSNIEEISVRTQNTAKSIGNLNDRTNDVAKMLDVIKGIAEQTNLLALNAAIEAARAGDQGRGFAVVADEVRALAQRTQESTVEIENIIGQFQKESASATNEMAQNEEQVKESVLFVSKVQDSLSIIMENVVSVSEKSQQIAAAAEEQVSVSNELASQAQEVGDLSQIAASGGEEIAASSREQAALADQLRTLAARFIV